MQPLYTVAPTHLSLFSEITDYIFVRFHKLKKLDISLSGGKTPVALFDFWAKEADFLRSPEIRFFFGDERCVSPNDDESNYKMAKKHLFDKIGVDENRIFRIKGEGDPNLEARRYSEVLDKELDKINGIPSFDVLILGMGSDGHTASIFPDQLKSESSDQNCFVARHPQSGQLRISISEKIISAAKNIAFLVTGEEKSEKVKEIFHHREKFANDYPAARIDPEKSSVHWFLDTNSASRL